MRLSSGLTCLLLLSLPSALADEPEKKCKACEKTAAAESMNVEPRDTGPPWICPLFELLAMGDGNLYYCNYYETTDCSDEPQAVYIFGVYDFPTDCADNNCFGDAFRARSGTGFKGLKFAVGQAYLHKMPSGRAHE